MKKTIALAGTVMLFVAGLLFLPGCRNAVTPSAPRTGTITLGIAGEGDVLRAILPETEMSEFNRFELTFTPVVAPGGAIYEPTWTGPSGSATLNVGTWTVAVRAYLQATDTVPQAQTAAPIGITVAETGNDPVSIELRPIVAGYGTLAWNVNFIGDDITAAMMTVTGTGDTPGPFVINIFDNDGVGTFGTPLAAGLYEVSILLTLDGGRTETIANQALRIYQGLTSVFRETFSIDNFPMAVLDMILGSWTGTAWDWDYTGREVTWAHFGVAGNGGVAGVTEANFGALTTEFNTLATTFAPPVVGTNALLNLRQMVDAALIRNAAAPNFATFMDYEEAQAAITALTANTATITDWDWDENAAANTYTVTVELGIYEVGFPAFLRLDGDVIITGTPTVGQTLTAYVGGLYYDDAVGTTTFQWIRQAALTPDDDDDYGNITGANANTHVLTVADQGDFIAVLVRRTDHFGSARAITPTAVVAAPEMGTISISFADWNGITPVTVPEIVLTNPGPGPLYEGLTRTITINYAADGIAPASIQWFRGNSATPIETGATFNFTPAIHENLVGTHVLTVRATIGGIQYSMLVSVRVVVLPTPPTP